MGSASMYIMYHFAPRAKAGSFSILVLPLLCVCLFGHVNFFGKADPCFVVDMDMDMDMD
jgi:hypothetical protein